MNSQSEQKRIAFGYNRTASDKIVLHTGQAAAVKLIFQYYTEGLSLAKIRDILESMRLPSPLNGPKWNKQTITNILSNPHYLGDEIYPIIIGKEQFDLAQRIKKDSFGNKKLREEDNGTPSQDSSAPEIT